VPDDYYQVLGVSSHATEDEIKRAYLRLARELHPDANPDDATTEERFKLVNRAYETLRDPERRRQYDMFGADGPRVAGGGDPFSAAGGFGDLFDAFFGGGGGFGGGSPFGGGGRVGRSGPRQGEDAESVLDLEFADAVFGVGRELTVRLLQRCSTCDGSGARPGTTPVTCSLCKGSGELRRVRQSLLGQMVTSGPCQQCGGTGEEIPSKCQDCAGQGRRRDERTFVVDVPPGVDSGTTLRLTGRGAAGLRGGPPGDLYVHVRVRPHPAITRDGFDLHGELRLALTQAALGATVPFETLEGVEELSVSPGTQTGRQIRLRGKGVPHLGRHGRGDLVVTLVVETPTELSKPQEELLRQLAFERGEPVADPDSGLMSRIRSAFKS
jgi:molecular chaperone DnaJ